MNIYQITRFVEKEITYEVPAENMTDAILYADQYVPEGVNFIDDYGISFDKLSDFFPVERFRWEEIRTKFNKDRNDDFVNSIVEIKPLGNSEELLKPKRLDREDMVKRMDPLTQMFDIYIGVGMQTIIRYTESEFKLFLRDMIAASQDCEVVHYEIHSAIDKNHLIMKVKAKI